MAEDGQAGGGDAPGAPHGFRPVTAADLPLLAGWLAMPEVRRWWGDPAEQLALITQDLAEPRMRQWLVLLAGRPFAYAQAYRLDAWPQAHWGDLPGAALAIDCFVGPPDLRGQGHGSAFLARLAEGLLAEGAPAVVIDPDAENLRACRAYARAGFKLREVVPVEGERVAVMVFGGRAGAPL